MKLVPLEQLLRRIVLLRDVRVMLSGDLAALYGVEHRALLQAVRRNAKRFPSDFMFQLTSEEADNLRSQIVISSSGHGGARHAPFAFSEQGVAMLSSVLRSERAIAVDIHIMRAFVADRLYLVGNRELARQISEMKKACDGRFSIVFRALEQLQARASPPRRPSDSRADATVPQGEHEQSIENTGSMYSK